MKNLIDISSAFTWFVLCITAAVFLLVVALAYNVFLALRRASVAKKIELSRIQLAK